MEKEYLDKKGEIFLDIILKTTKFMEKINAKFVKEEHIDSNYNFLIGEKSSYDKLYSIDSFYNLVNKTSSNNIVLNFKNENSLIGYAELIKAGIFLLCQTNLISEDDVVVKVNIVNDKFKEDFEELKLILLDLDINYEICDDLKNSNATDFCFNYVIGEDAFVIGGGARYNTGIYFKLDIDEMVKFDSKVDIFVENYVDCYIIATTKEEKLYALKIMDEQRGCGLKSLIFTENIDKESQYEKAKSSMCEWIVKIDEENLQKGLVTLQNIYSDEEDLIDIDEVNDKIIINY